MNTGQTYVEERKFFLPSQESEDAIFRKIYDDVQMQLQTLAGMNDLLSGTVGPRVGILHRILIFNPVQGLSTKLIMK